jgi:hypothetical protein
LPSTSLGLRILTEIPPQSNHMAAMRAYRAEADGCFTSQTNPARAGTADEVIRRTCLLPVMGCALAVFRLITS